jgi:5-hydroxyisourate hydrolase
VSLSTHVLDTARGEPASGVPVTLEHHDGAGWVRVAE